MTPISVGDAAQWVSAVASLLALGISIVAILTRRQHEDVATALRGVSDHALRLASLEVAMAAMPSKTSVHNIEVGMAKMQGQMDVIAERVRPLGAAIDRLQTAMLEPAK